MLKKIKERVLALDVSGRSEIADYWTEHNVTQHRRYPSAEASLEYFKWRSDQYYTYLDLLPVAGHDGEIVLDFGCGPGHDLVGFGHWSKPARLIGADVSRTSLEEAEERMRLHGFPVELITVDETRPRLPLEDASVDYVHSSGVIHHVSEPKVVLDELRRVIKPDGEARVMIYNYDSLFLHLHVAYLTQMVSGQYANEPVRDAFSHLTDGPGCPISRIHRPDEFIAVANASGFRTEHLGNAMSMYEMQVLPKRFEAVQNEGLPAEHREFLLGLRFDEMGYPRHGEHLAGVDGCFRLIPV